MIPRLSVALVALAIYGACAIREGAVTPPQIDPQGPTIDLLIFTPSGWPIKGVTVFASDRFQGGRLFECDGWLRLFVTGPTVISVHKAGYASVPARFYIPGEHRITLYPMSRANE